MKRTPTIFTYAVLGAWSFVCLFPLYWVAVTSLKGAGDIVSGPFYLPFVDFRPALDAWNYILWDSSDDPLLRYVNSIVVGSTSTVLTMLLGGLAVYGFTRFRHAIPWTSFILSLLAAALAACAFLVPVAAVRLGAIAVAGTLIVLLARRPLGGPAFDGSAILSAMLATRILPPVILVLPIYLMAQRMGVLDTRSALILTYTATNLPVAVWLLRPVFGERAGDQEEAAQLDGASHFGIFFSIAVPMAAGGIVAASLLIFLLCWNEYLFSVYLAGDQAMTMPPFLAAQMTVREQQAGSDAEEWAHLCAAILLMAGPMIVVAGLAQRVLARMTLWDR